MDRNLKLKSLEISNLILEKETHVDWDNILEIFEFSWLLDEVPRLIRSQYWGDNDYAGCVRKVVSYALFEDEVKSCDMIEYILKNCTEVSDDEIKDIILDLKANETLIINRTTNEELNLLIDNINNSVYNGKPIFALDRLHTLMIKYVKELCANHNIQFDKDDRLDVLFKHYVNYIKEYIDSDMSLTILKANISIFSQFNNVRNNYTYAHDNNVLNDAESKLIFKNIVNVKEFIDELENEVFILEQ